MVVLLLFGPPAVELLRELENDNSLNDNNDNQNILEGESAIAVNSAVAAPSLGLQSAGL